MTNNQILLGTSGWSYKEWEGNFYRKSENKKLRAYARFFKTVEIDSSFYRNPSKGAVMGWIRYSPPDFVFSAKIPKLITHTKKLGLKGEVEADLEEFLEIMQPLQLSGKLACLLVQLPPKYGYDLQSLEAFFKLLDTRFRYAVEFRNISWLRDETWNLLKTYNIAYTNVDEPLLPSDVHLTTDFSYFRWHGRGKNIWFDYRYSPQELNGWVPKINDVASKVKKIFGYFNNHFHGYAPENCLYMLEQLGLASKAQEHAKKELAKQSHLFDFSSE